MSSSVSSPHPEYIPADLPRQLHDQTDRACAIIGGAWIENQVEQLLLARMCPLSSKRREYLFEGFGPLAGFASKIEVAFAFHLFESEARTDLLLVNSIRNKFAHEIAGGEWTFDHPGIAKFCDQFDWVNKAKGSPGDPPVTNRGKFIGTIYYLAGQLYGETAANPQTPFQPAFLVDGVYV